MGRRKGRKRRREREPDENSVAMEALRRSEARRGRRRRATEPDASRAQLDPNYRSDDLRAVAWQPPGPRDLMAIMRDGDDTPATKAKLTCEGCHEFVPNEDFGRGTCLHPGSGIVAPWTDTEACQFHEPRRRR